MDKKLSRVFWISLAVVLVFFVVQSGFAGNVKTLVDSIKGEANDVKDGFQTIVLDIIVRWVLSPALAISGGLSIYKALKGKESLVVPFGAFLGGVILWFIPSIYQAASGQ